MNQNSVQVILITDFARVDYVRASGAYRIATELRNRNYTVQIIDHFTWLTDEQKIQLIEKFMGDNTLVVGFSTTFMGFKTHNQVNEDNIHDNGTNVPISKNTLKHIRETIKKINPKTKIVVGGSRADWLFDDEVDIFIKGYAEGMLLSLLDELSNKRVSEKRIVFTKEGKKRIIIDNDANGSTFDFSNSYIDYSDRELVQFNEVLPIEISRGCMFKCKFCSYPLIGRKKNDYLKNTDTLFLEMMRNYEKFNTTHYMIMDDTFNESVDKLKKINEVFKRLPFKPNFWAYIRHDLLHTFPEMIDLLEEMGLRTATFGIETLNSAASKAVGKGLSSEKTIQLLYQLKSKWKNKIRLHSGFILGLPHETYRTLVSWSNQVTDPSFPIDSATFNGLVININENRVWKSEFEKNILKYGYTFPKPGYDSYWVTNEINSVVVSKLSNYYNTRAKRNMVLGAATACYGFKNLGFDFEETFNRKLSDFETIDLGVAKTKRKALVQDYYNFLLKI